MRLVVFALLVSACTSGAVTTTESATTEPPTPTTAPTTAETGPSRVVFLAGLDNAGWATYLDEIAGWSVRYPRDWAVGEATEPGRRLTLVTPSAEASLIIVLADDAGSDDESSGDYLARHARAAIDSGAFRPADDGALSLLHLDVDFDGRVDPQDIVSVDLVVTSDAEGTAGSDDTELTSWYAYYDPAGSSYAYAFETVGQDPELTRYADDIVFSFEPPGGYPGLPSTQAAPSDPYALFGEVVAVVDTALGAVTWRQASSIPLDLVGGDQLPDPSHRWENRWLALYESAQDATGACFEIFEETSGYLGLGPCAADWLPQHSWHVEVGGGPRIWEPNDRKWNWLNQVWFSPDGVDWNQTTQAFPDSTAVVAAEPWSVAERDGQWVVIGASGVSRDAETLPEDQTKVERRIAELDVNTGGLDVPRSAEPAAWVSDNLPFGWKRVFVDFGEEGTDTRLTSVVAGEAGWVIFGIRASHAPTQVVQWVGWVSTDGITWEELPMADVFDTPCEPTEHDHCGLIKAHMLDDAIVAYAWTWPPGEEHALPTWALLIGTVGNPD